MSEHDERGPLSERTDQEITDDVTAALQIVGPMWMRYMYPITLPLWVRDQLDELEADARSCGYAATGCMEVRYEPEDGKMTWSVVIACRYDDPDGDTDIEAAATPGALDE